VKIVIDPSIIKSAFEADKIYGRKFVDEFNSFVDELCLALPSMLDEMLNQPVNMATLIASKLKLMAYLINSDALYRYDGELQKKIFYLSDRTYKFVATEFNLILGMNRLQEILKNPQIYLVSKNLSERDIITSTRTGFTGENNSKYQNGTLTIGELLITQPNVLLRNLDVLL
jgi:hypothetical protein